MSCGSGRTNGRNRRFAPSREKPSPSNRRSNRCTYTCQAGFSEYLVWLADDREDFTSDIAFKATDDFDLAHSFCCSSTQVGPCPQIVAQPTFTVPRRREVTDRSALDDGNWIEFELTVTDGDGESATDKVKLTISGITWTAGS